ncbi:hypothetical protein H6785_03775 [Candidatus Nomurabacteria bacterium]|nr:hypothetical protein [Candidatus Nomurabacteria bacterium]
MTFEGPPTIEQRKKFLNSQLKQLQDLLVNLPYRIKEERHLGDSQEASELEDRLKQIPNEIEAYTNELTSIESKIQSAVRENQNDELPEPDYLPDQAPQTDEEAKRIASLEAKKEFDKKMKRIWG